jgi:hypothetical protein
MTGDRGRGTARPVLANAMRQSQSSKNQPLFQITAALV